MIEIKQATLKDSHSMLAQTLTVNEVFINQINYIKAILDDTLVLLEHDGQTETFVRLIVSDRFIKSFMNEFINCTLISKCSYPPGTKYYYFLSDFIVPVYEYKNETQHSPQSIGQLSTFIRCRLLILNKYLGKPSEIIA